MLLVEVLGSDHPLADQHGDHSGRVEREVQRGPDRFGDILRVVGAIHVDAGRLEHLLRRLPHRDLPRIELAPLAAHRDQHHEGHTAFVLQRQHVDAVAHAARLQ
jgi:hypothetical protein